MTHYELNRADFLMAFILGLIVGLILRLFCKCDEPPPERNVAAAPTERKRGSTKPIAIVPKTGTDG